MGGSFSWKDNMPKFGGNNHCGSGDVFDLSNDFPRSRDSNFMFCFR